MKKIFFLVLFFGSVLFADGINWVHNYDKGLELAKAEDKSVLLFISSKDCYFSNYMKNTTFSAFSVKQIVKENFIAVEVEKGSDFYPKEKFKIKGTPAIFFLDSDGERIWYPMAGMANKKRLIYEINNVLIRKDRRKK